MSLSHYPRRHVKPDDLNQSLEERVVYLLLHGILHLLGYEHEGPAAQRRRMEALEQAVLAHLQA